MLFWAVGSAEKKYCSFRTKQLHSLKVKKNKNWKVFYFGLRKANYLIWNKSVIHIGPDPMVSSSVSDWNNFILSYSFQTKLNVTTPARGGVNSWKLVFMDYATYFCQMFCPKSPLFHPMIYCFYVQKAIGVAHWHFFQH